MSTSYCYFYISPLEFNFKYRCQGRIHCMITGLTLKMEVAKFPRRYEIPHIKVGCPGPSPDNILKL